MHPFSQVCLQKIINVLCFAAHFAFWDEINGKLQKISDQFALYLARIE